MAYTRLHPRTRRDLRDTLILIAVAISIFATSVLFWINTTRQNWSSDLSSLRHFVSRICGPVAPVYLDLVGVDQKTRQIFSLYLSDRVLKSDWRDDGYFSDVITNPVDKLERGDCLIETAQTAIKSPGFQVGQFNIHLVGNEIRLGQPNMPNLMEHDGANRWLWAGQSVTFPIEDFRDKPAADTQVTFEIMATRQISVSAIVDGIHSKTTTIYHDGKGVHSYSIPIEGGSKEITLKTDAAPIDVGAGKIASYYLRDIAIATKR